MDEAELDRLLAMDQVADPTAALRTRILAAAPGPRPRRLGWLAASALGLGLATCGAAGVAVGFELAPPSVASFVGHEVSSEAGDAAQPPDPLDAADNV